MTLRVSAFLVSILFTAGLAAYLRWRFRANRLHRVFAFMVAGVSAYGVFVTGLALATDAVQAQAWIRLAAVLSYSCLFGFYWFAMVFSGAEAKPWSRRVLGVAGAAAAADIGLRLLGLGGGKLVHIDGQGWFPAEDPLYFFVYIPVMLVLVGSALAALAQRHRATINALERRQIAYIFLAIGGAVGLTFFNLSPGLAPLAALAPIFFVSVISYGITRHQLLDLRILLRQGAVGAVLSTALAFMLAVTLFVSTKVFSQEIALGGVISLFLSAVLFTALYEPLRRFSANLLDRWLVIPQVDVSASLLEYSQLVGRHPRLEDFFGRACERLRSQHRLSHCMVLLPDRHGKFAVYASSPAQYMVEPVQADADLLRRLVASPLGVDADELSWVRRFERGPAPAQDGADEGLRRLLDSMGCQALFTLRSGDNRSLGLLALGAERSGRGFSAAERSFFGALATLLSSVLENALLQGQMRHADRLQSLGALAAGLAHELRNPLSSILVFVQMLPERFHEESFREKFQRVVQLELNKLNRLTEQLLQISKPGLRTTVALDLHDELERARQLVAYQFRRREVGLELRCAEGTMVKASSDELGQVLLNLFLNALAVSPKATAVRVRVEAEAAEVSILVEDEGPGIPAAQLPRLFEPFFSTKSDGNGLGLATSLRIVESFGGSLLGRNRAEGGACFVVRLPRAGADLGARKAS